MVGHYPWFYVYQTLQGILTPSFNNSNSNSGAWSNTSTLQWNNLTLSTVMTVPAAVTRYVTGHEIWSNNVSNVLLRY